MPQRPSRRTARPARTPLLVASRCGRSNSRTRPDRDVVGFGPIGRAGFGELGTHREKTTAKREARRGLHHHILAVPGAVAAGTSPQLGPATLGRELEVHHAGNGVGALLRCRPVPEYLEPVDGVDRKLPRSGPAKGCAQGCALYAPPFCGGQWKCADSAERLRSGRGRHRIHRGIRQPTHRIAGPGPQSDWVA